MHRNSTDGRLEQRELVRHEGIAVDEVVFVTEVGVLLPAVGKLKECLEVVELLAVGGLQQLGTDLVFGQQTLLNHLCHVGAGEFEAVGKAGLDLGKVVALLFAHVPEHGVHVFLRGDDDPGTTLAFGG